MKNFIFFLCAITISHFVNAQSVGIGTITPNASAALEIKSTTKGLLIPTMSSTQRININSPFNGLLVYDSSVSRLYQYQDGIWRYLINNDYWLQSSTRKWVYNTSDSVGIGTSTPDERLEVVGNIRSTNNIMATNNITASGSINGASFSTGGNITAAGTSLLSGNVTTNSDLNINNTTATLQLKSSAVNKGFFQLAGENVRMGTNSGNTTGNLVIRMNGNDRVQINPSGDIDLDGKITRSSVTGTNSLLPICYGYVNANGSILSGTGNFSITKDFPYPGRYKIISPYFSSSCIMMITPASYGHFGSAFSQSATEFWVDTYDAIAQGLRDSRFYFIVYKPN